MAESFENLDNILHDWTKDKYKNSTVEALNRLHSLARKRKIKPFLSLIENGSEIVLEQSAVERDKPNTKLVLVSGEPLLNKSNKQNVVEIDSFNKFSISQLQKILDTLIMFRNTENQKITS